MTSDGYGEIVNAAAKLACSAIVDREVREQAQTFLSTEIARWDETPVADEEEHEGPEAANGPQD